MGTREGLAAAGEPSKAREEAVRSPPEPPREVSGRAGRPHRGPALGLGPGERPRPRCHPSGLVYRPAGAGAGAAPGAGPHCRRGARRGRVGLAGGWEKRGDSRGAAPPRALRLRLCPARGWGEDERQSGAADAARLPPPLPLHRFVLPEADSLLNPLSHNSWTSWIFFLTLWCSLLCYSSSFSSSPELEGLGGISRSCLILLPHLGGIDIAADRQSSRVGLTYSSVHQFTIPFLGNLFLSPLLSHPCPLDFSCLLEMESEILPLVPVSCQFALHLLTRFGNTDL